MAGTHEGGQKAAETRKQKDPDAFRKMGEKGGKEAHGGKGKNEERK